jgi:carboxymethylenebutenolidase
VPLGRRAFVTQTIALAAFPAIAAKPPPPPKTANIRWPGPDHEIHGYMAIPAKAHGPQPAVLVVHDSGGADTFIRSLADRLADAGFVACAPTRLASLDEATATVGWLATNAYATGKVAAVGIGWGGELVQRIAAAPDTRLDAAVTFGASESTQNTPVPLLPFGPIAAMAAADYAQAWLQTLAFLKAKLG